MKAVLIVTQTSANCIKYMLVDQDGQRLWSNRVENRPEGHQGARSRMATWALAHGCRVVERQPAPQRLIAGRYGR